MYKLAEAHCVWSLLPCDLLDSRKEEDTATLWAGTQSADQKVKEFEFSMVGFFLHQLFVKMFSLFGDHRLWLEAGEPEVPAIGRRLVETEHNAGLNQDYYM